MKKEYIEYEEPIDDTYGEDSDEDIELLDEVEDIEGENEDIDLDYFNESLISYLTYELSIIEPYRKIIEFKYLDKKYSGIVVGKSKEYQNRYFFKIVPGDELKAFWTDKIDLI